MNNQVTLLHFSDLHFGLGHRFYNQDEEAKNMATSIIEGIDEHILQSKPIMIAVTGDFINAKDKDNVNNNFNSAFDFLNSIYHKIFNNKIDSSNIFIVPGNHDVAHEDLKNNFDNYHEFYKRIHEKNPSLVEIRKCDNPKIIIAEINSCSFVKNDPKGLRGKVTTDAINKMKDDLNVIKKNPEFNDYLKIAMLHHHIVLLPPFVKKKEGNVTTNDEIVNDTIVNDSDLIDVLNNNNFHLILHGHKHHPCQYLHDPNSYWDKKRSKIPILIVAGGSCGSKELPRNVEIPCNTFNILQINWETKGQITIKLTVKGLQIDNDKMILPHNEWYWETIKYREFRFQYQQTNKCEWKIIISDEALDTSDALIYCLRNCLLKDSDFLNTVYPDQDYKSTKLTVYDISTLKYKYIEAILDAIKDQIQKNDLLKICDIRDNYDISEKYEADIIKDVKCAKIKIENFLKKYKDGSES